MRIISIVCVNSNRAIGYNNNLIYNIPSEFKLFKKNTTSTHPEKKHAVIMGRKTFESIGCKPLPNRLNFVVSANAVNLTSMYRFSNLKFFKSIEESLEYVYKNEKTFQDLFVCGGYGIYKYFTDNNLVDFYYISKITRPINNIGDSFFPEINTDDKEYLSIYNETFTDQPAKFNVTGEDTTVDYTFDIFYNLSKRNTSLTNTIKHTILEKLPYYSKTLLPHPETQYLDILNDVLQWGKPRQSRNALTLSRFGKTMTFDISNNFPLLTTKKVFWKGVLHELLWFLKADTNANHLSENGVKIWDGNTTREYLDSIGLDRYNVGECGPIYGFQWRHFNAKYNGCNADYTDKGIDQLQNIVNLINNDPTSRRMIMSGWNPEQLKEMCLPPCHVSYQFYVRIDTITKEKHLSCSMYQRSGDLFLGVPFNIASTAALTYIIANLTNCKPEKIMITIGDAHIYKEHINAVEEQLKRVPYAFPSLKINGEHSSLESYKYEDFLIEDYKSHPSIKAPMIA